MLDLIINWWNFVVLGIGLCATKWCNNKYEETNYKYAYVLDNIIKYEKPKNISEFKNKNGESIKNPPQSYIYTIN